METRLHIFNFQGNSVRTVIRDNEPWWVLKDVCDTLGLAEPHRVASRLEEDDRTQMTVIDSLGRSQETTVINESGIYDVIIRSDKPEARKFKHWLTREVLPQIRRTGFYVDGQISTSNLKLLQQTVTELIDTREKLESSEKERNLLAERLDESLQMWSIKKRCALLGVDYHWYLDKTGRNQGWRKLKALSAAMGKAIRKIEDVNYPEGVNVYDITVMEEAERLFAEAA